MEENTTVQTEQEEDLETSSAFDEGWDDDDKPETFDDGQGDGDAEPEEPDTAEESEGTEADADQQEADGNEGGETDASSEAESKGDEGSSDQGESFLLKHLGEEKSVGRDEVVALAQKGLDYDRIREKWDGIKDDVAKLRMYENFLAELAEARGGDIESLIDETRTRSLLARAEAKGENLTPAAAAAMAVKMRTDFTPANTGADPEEARQEKSQREITRFLQAYPEVPATDIPKEVWDDVRDENGANGDLLGAYRGWENKKLSEEIKQLKKQLEEKEQKAKNKARSTGSTKSVGSSAGRDAFDEGWDAGY